MPPTAMKVGWNASRAAEPMSAMKRPGLGPSRRNAVNMGISQTWYGRNGRNGAGKLILETSGFKMMARAAKTATIATCFVSIQWPSSIRSVEYLTLATRKPDCQVVLWVGCPHDVLGHQESLDSRRDIRLRLIHEGDKCVTFLEIRCTLEPCRQRIAPC